MDRTFDGLQNRSRQQRAEPVARRKITVPDLLNEACDNEKVSCGMNQPTNQKVK
jgi:hypothetical protein